MATSHPAACIPLEYHEPSKMFSSCNTRPRRWLLPQGAQQTRSQNKMASLEGWSWLQCKTPCRGPINSCMSLNRHRSRDFQSRTQKEIMGSVAGIVRIAHIVSTYDSCTTTGPMIGTPAVESAYVIGWRICSQYTSRPTDASGPHCQRGHGEYSAKPPLGQISQRIGIPTN